MNQAGRKRPGRGPRLQRASTFAGPAGEGWCRQLPGHRPLATPAVVDGRVFVGGGFGSYEFYSFGLADGRHNWTYRTADDGPTAAAVSEGFVAFNTESCELEVLTVEGVPAWKRWLGDPLMGMPAIADGRVHMVYPDSRGNREHHLASFRLRDGKPLWRVQISGEVITAPVVDRGKVYATTLDGRLWCVDAGSGNLDWQADRQATSAPTVHRGECHFSQKGDTDKANATARTDRPQQPSEDPEAWGDSWEVQAFLATGGMDHGTHEATRQKAEYLDMKHRRRRSKRHRSDSQRDSGVGFASSKGHSKMYQAQRLLGRSTVAGVWSYQGSKPFIAGGRKFSSMGSVLKCVNLATGETEWERRLVSDDTPVDSLVTPPSLAGGKVFVGTDTGDVHCLSQATGEELWKIRVGGGIVFPPAVTAGWCITGTVSGKLVAFETGDPADDGWHMWGATAAHNGLAESADPLRQSPKKVAGQQLQEPQSV